MDVFQIKSIILGITASLLFFSPVVVALDEQFYSGNDILFYNPESQTCTQATLPSTTSGSIGVTVDKDFTLGTDNNKRAVNLARKLMEDYNWSDFQAAGVVGNFMVESGGDHVPPDVNEGGEAGPPKFSGGYGWAQWTGGRQVTFIDFAVSKGYMASKSVNATDAANYAYLNQELTATAESKVVDALKATKTVEEAVVTWEEVFERAGIPNNDARISDANKVLTALKGNGSIEGVTGETTGGNGTYATDCGSENTAVQVTSSKFSNVAFPLIGSKSVVNNPDIFTGSTTSLGGHPYTAYDIYANAGTKVVAFASGTVTQISEDKCGSRLVGIYNKEAGAIVSYMHLNTNDNVAKDTDVSPGDPVGTVGSVKQYPCVNVDHLHIDAMTGNVREDCAREYCPAATKAKFIDIGPDLFNAYQQLPN